MLPFVLLAQLALGQYPSLENAAAKYVPGTVWQPRSVVTGDFSCHGRKEQAILGVNSAEIVIAVFLYGTNRQPEVLRYSAKTRNPKTANLATEDLDYDPKSDIGYALPGFQQSKRCKGLNLSDREVDSVHIYWNHKAGRFDGWVR